MSQGSEQSFDPVEGHQIYNDTDVSNDDVFQALQQQHPEIASLVRWGTEQKRSRSGGLFSRDRYMTPANVFDQFKVAVDAAENDDVVTNVLESTEALAFNKVEMSCEDEQEEDIWNQIIEDIEMDARLREMWRETFTVSQFYAAVVWGNKTFKPRSKTKAGNKSKKVFSNIRVPIAITILDPLRVIPVGQTLFGQNKLAYIAEKDEATHIEEVLAGTNTADQVITQVIKGKYTPSRTEAQYIREITGVHRVENLYELNLDNVFRHTATKPDYMRFANVRMKSVFELLDLKHNLRQMDRAYLLGATNFIILVKKGSEKQPAVTGEIEDVATQIRGSSVVPVIIGDHRLEIEIITPDIDLTLKAERYDTLDSRIHARLYQMFISPSGGGSGDDSLKLGRVVARGMESRRLMILNTLMKSIFKKTFEANDEFSDMPTMDFHPQRIALDFDNNIAVFLQDLRDRGDISRDTILSELDIDQAKEARLRKREKEKYDKVFEATNVPFSGSAPGAPGAGGPPGQMGGPMGGRGRMGNPKAAGRAGGGSTGGGGNNPQSGRSGPGRGTTAKPAPKPRQAAKKP